MSTFRSIGLGLFVGATALAAQPAQAAVLLYEGFNYTIGSALAGAGSATDPGWETAWMDPNEAGTISAGLSYQTGEDRLLTEGNAVTVTGTGIVRDAVQIDVTSTPGMVAYVSFLVRMDESADDFSLYVRRSPRSSNQVAFSFGRENQSANYLLRTLGGPAINTGVAIGRDTAFIVLEIDNADNPSVFSVWINPVLATTAPTPTVDRVEGKSGNRAHNIMDINLSVTNGTVTFDEIRVGRSWADVVPFAPVPEPTSLTLLGCGGALALRRRRAR